MKLQPFPPLEFLYRSSFSLIMVNCVLSERILVCKLFMAEETYSSLDSFPQYVVWAIRSPLSMLLVSLTLLVIRPLLTCHPGHCHVLRVLLLQLSASTEWLLQALHGFGGTRPSLSELQLCYFCPPPKGLFSTSQEMHLHGVRFENVKNHYYSLQQVCFSQCSLIHN